MSIDIHVLKFSSLDYTISFAPRAWRKYVQYITLQNPPEKTDLKLSSKLHPEILLSDYYEGGPLDPSHILPARAFRRIILLA